MPAETLLANLIGKHQRNGLLVDTNLLLLLIVGLYDRRRVASFKRTSAYTLDDFQRIGWLVKQFTQLWTTPNILTEVDNLGRQLPTREWKNFSTSLKELCLKMKEENVSSSIVVACPTFDRLGLTDSATLSLKQSFLIISDDFPLYQEALRQGYDAINFNHLRVS